jgi:hypothetical protein
VVGALQVGALEPLVQQAMPQQVRLKGGLPGTEVPPPAWEPLRSRKVTHVDMFFVLCSLLSSTSRTEAMYSTVLDRWIWWIGCIFFDAGFKR